MEKPVTLAAAKKILGQGKILPHDEVCHAWNSAPPRSTAVLYGAPVLRFCARENRLGLSDWRLTYVIGMSLIDQLGVLGACSDNGRPCFARAQPWPWWLGAGLWAVTKAEPGYRLINFRLELGQLSWLEQEEALFSKGGHQVRTADNVFAESVLSWQMATREVLADGACHWGRFAVEKDKRLAIGYLDSGGIQVNFCELGDSRPENKVSCCLAREVF